jgi:hypothetical protein
MEQVLAPRFEFKPKNPTSKPSRASTMARAAMTRTSAMSASIRNRAVPDRDQGAGRAEERGSARICREDLNEVIAAFVQDKTTIERGLFDEELVPEELTQVRMGKIIKDKYPELDGRSGGRAPARHCRAQPDSARPSRPRSAMLERAMPSQVRTQP